MSFSEFTHTVSAFFKTDRGKTILKWVQYLINIAILAWLLYQLTDIGWLEVWESLPTQPLFYLLFLVTFFQLPLFEVLIYRLTWTFDALKSIPIFLLKRVYNKEVMGYSGEVYFFVWARKNLPIKGREILKIIKDNNIISSVASTLITFGLLAIFLFTDQIKIIQLIAGQNLLYFVGGILVVVILVFLFIKFRHNVISMPIKTAYQIFGIQTVRLLFNQTVTFFMYVVVLPDIPLYVWFTYIAVEIILSRIPFLPSKDLLFASISIQMAGPLDVAQGPIAGIMIARSVLNKVIGVACYGLAHLLKQSEFVPNPEDNTDDFERFNALSSDMEDTEDK